MSSPLTLTFIKDDDYRVVILDKSTIKNSTEETIIVAEELVHYDLDATYHMKDTYNTSYQKFLRNREETRAKREVVHRLIPVKSIKECLKRHISNIHEMAEELCVTEELLKYAIEYYRSKKELKPNWGHS